MGGCQQDSVEAEQRDSVVVLDLQAEREQRTYCRDSQGCSLAIQHFQDEAAPQELLQAVRHLELAQERSRCLQRQCDGYTKDCQHQLEKMDRQLTK